MDGVRPGGGGAATGADAVAGSAGLGVWDAAVCLVVGAVAAGNGVASGYAEEAVGTGDWAYRRRAEQQSLSLSLASG